MAVDLQEIRRNYESFDDVEIEEIAKHDIASLEPGVVAILKDEIRRRGLDTNLNKGIDAQAKELTPSDISDLKSRITGLPCPHCGQRSKALIGRWVREVKSLLIHSQYRKTPVILCEPCAEDANSHGIAVTVTLGWWSLPWGIIATTQALIASVLDFRKLQKQSDEILTSFVIANLGEIRTNFEDEAKLVDFIRRWNQTN